MLKFKKTFLLGLSLSLLLTPLTAYASGPILNKNYYSIDKKTGQLKLEGNIHFASPIDFDSNWYTVNVDGKNISYKIKNIRLNEVATAEAPVTGLSRIYSLANGQTLQQSLSSTIVQKKGTILNKKSSNKLSTSVGFSICKLLNFKAGLSKTLDTSVTSTNTEETNESTTYWQQYAFANQLIGKGYNSLDFYTATAHDVYDIDTDIIEHSREAMVTTGEEFTYNDKSIYCRECGKFLKNNEILMVAPSPESNGNEYLTLAHVKDSSKSGGRNVRHIGYPTNGDIKDFLAFGYSRIVVDGDETILPDEAKISNMTLQYMKPFPTTFSYPWKVSDPIPTTPDPKTQLVAPGTQKIIEDNGQKYLITITDSSLISRTCLPDEPLTSLKFSIANGQTISKEISTTLTKTSSLEKISSGNYNFSSGLSGSLFKILSFEAGYNKSMNGASTTITSQSVTINMSSKNTYFFPDEFSSQGNSLVFSSTNDYAEFLITAQATPINVDGSYNTNGTINMSFKYRQPFIKNFSAPRKF